MAGYEQKKDCPCDSPIHILLDGKDRYFPCCRCDICIARMQLYFSDFINGEEQE